MKFGLPISLALHGAVLAVSVVGFGFKAKAAPEMRVIPVKIFTISDTTNVRAAKKAPDPVQTPVETPPESQTTPAENPVVESDPAPQSKAEPAPKPDAKPKAAPEQTAEVKPSDIPAEPKDETPKPLSLDDLSALVAGSKGKSEDGQKLLKSEQAQIELAADTRAGAGQGTGLTTAYEDAIMRRIYNSWRIPSGAPDLESLVVSIDVSLNRDGKVVTAALTPDSARKASTNDYYRTAAESAVRAVQDAAQFKFLPRAEYERWRNLSLTFFPKDAPTGGVPT